MGSAVEQAFEVFAQVRVEVGMRRERRNVRVRSKANGEVKETVIALDEDGAAKRVEAAVAEGGLLSVHTEEATLEDIFIDLAGKGLSA